MTRFMRKCLPLTCLIVCSALTFAEEKTRYRIEEPTPAGKYRMVSVTEAETFCVSDKMDWDSRQETRSVTTAETSEPGENGLRKNKSVVEEYQTTLTMPWATMEYDSRYKDKQSKDFIPTQAAWLGVAITRDIDEQERPKSVEGLDKVYDNLAKSHNRKMADMHIGGFKEKPLDFCAAVGHPLSALRTEPKAIGEEWEEKDTCWTMGYGECKRELKHVLKSVENGVAVLETKLKFAPVSDVLETVRGKNKIEFFEAEVTILKTFELKNGVLRSVQASGESTSHTETIPDENSEGESLPAKEIMVSRYKTSSTIEVIE